MVVVPVMVLGRGLPSPGLPHNQGSLAAPVHWDRSGIGRVIKACLMYAWGGGFVFGLAQYGLVSALQGWSSTRTQGMTLTMSLGIGIGMLLAGLLGARVDRRGWVLLAGTVVNAVVFLVLVLSRTMGVVPALIMALLLGLSLGVQVLAFPMAEEAAPDGQTALTVAIVNTFGTVFGAVMALVSGFILNASAFGELTPVLMTYGVLALFGIVIASWIQCKPPLIG